ncbi:hypothetical protein [Pseudomonas citronellolis]|uniref:hypothetical protein n=1 Tax=Pseudomonas citronellolis TaxID=53408 RepID=UPI0023E36287|nr:hypothetical protein [Pseudomonas citronellolis]MDF3932185.1 hypothetical protein [Pseudomonas citronellolis]
MARTFRRRTCQYDFIYALWDIDEPDWNFKSVAVRRRLARFHSDSFFSWRKRPPRKFRKVDDRKLRQINQAALKRWLRWPYKEPLFMDIRRCPAWWPI